MTTPIYSLAEWAAAQASPWIGHNAALRMIEALIRGSIADRNLSAPPGSCADGAAYLVAGSASGAWVGRSGQLAVAVGVNAGNGWMFAAVAVEGALLWVDDENIRIEFDGASWVEFSGGGGGSGGAAVVTVISGTTADLDPADNGKYQRWTNGSAKTLTVQPEATTALPDDGEWHVRNAGSADLTIVEGSGVTINPPNGGTLVVPEGGTVTLKRVAEDEFDLLGQTVAA